MAFVAAFFGGFAARKLGLPALVGYLVAGVIIGPFTPEFMGDSINMNQLAEIGVVFMMFGVGLHFSLKDLWGSRAPSYCCAYSPTPAFSNRLAEE